MRGRRSGAGEGPSILNDRHAETTRPYVPCRLLTMNTYDDVPTTVIKKKGQNLNGLFPGVGFGPVEYLRGSWLRSSWVRSSWVRGGRLWSSS